MLWFQSWTVIKLIESLTLINGVVTYIACWNKNTVISLKGGPLSPLKNYH